MINVNKGDYTENDVHPDSDGIYPGQCHECDAVYPYHDIDLPDHC